MKYQEQISEWIDAREEELIRDTSRLVAIRSVKGEPAEGAPFGPGPRAALDEALAMCREYGFATELYGGAVGTADMNDKAPMLDILCHLDVVDEGTGWHGEPFVTELRDGCLYGRGTDDDKGPAVAALLAMRCVKALGVPLGHNCRLILGTDEESGSGDLPYYYDKCSPAPNTFTPDSGFPLYNVEKGRYAPKFETRFAPAAPVKPSVESITAGIRANVIANEAKAKVLGLSAIEVMMAASPVLARAETQLMTDELDDGCLITIKGKQGHAAYPWDANNPITALLEVLSALPLAECESSRAVRALSALFPHGDYYGRALGVAQRDELSGELTVSLNVLNMNANGIAGEFDARIPVCGNEDNFKKPVDEALRKAGFTAEGRMSAPHHTPEEGDFVQSLLACYEAVTGKAGECLHTGGGTYVHDIPGGVAFGAGMPGFESNLHGANERMNVRDMLDAAKIFALAICRICGE